MADRRFDESDCYGLIEKLALWETTRRKAGYFDTHNISPLPLVEMRKSRLLLRILQGKEPLPVPPPTFYSGPWYELIEDGHTEFSDMMDTPAPYPVGGPFEGMGWHINGSHGWQLVRTEGSDTEGRTTRVFSHPGAPGLWRLMPWPVRLASSGGWITHPGWRLERILGSNLAEDPRADAQA